MNLTAKANCPDCGTPLPSGVFGESCPKCQFGSALAFAPSAPHAVRIPLAGVAEPQHSPNLASAPVRVGDYELLEELGRGGMGIVYKARQISLNRLVALKMMLAGPLAQAEAVQRFRTEAETVARLRHPNVVSVHEIGEAEGRLFFSMDYVSGLNLAALARERPLSAREAATHLETIATAVAYAHRHGIVHRDLKPSNILLDDAGQPRITDFGLAKRFGVPPSGGSAPAEAGTPSEELTQSGQSLGSPSFSAPEQAAGRRTEVGTRSDIYSLGAVLYYLLTGRPPLLADTLEQTLWQVLHAEPVSPRLLNHSVPVDLETICLKCLEKSPARRYATAQELAEELGRFLRGEPIHARPAGALEKSWRWCRRKPVLATAAASVVALMAVVATIIAVSSVHLSRKESALQYRAYAADMRSAQQALEAGNYGLAIHFLNQHRPTAGERDLRGWEWRYVRSQARPEALLRVGRHRLVVSTVAFSPDGARLASGGSEGEVKLWDFKDRRELAKRQHQGAVNAVAFSANGRLIASAGSDGKIQLWDGATLAEALNPLHQEGEVLAMHFTQDGARLIAVALDRNTGWMRARAVTWDLAGHKRVDEQAVRAWSRAAFSPDGTILATGGANGEIWLWNLATKTELAAWIAHPNAVNVLAFSPDGQWLISAGLDKTAKVWAVPQRAAARLAGRGSTENVPPSPASETHGSTLPSGGLRSTATQTSENAGSRWNATLPEIGSELATLVGSDATIGAAAFSPDGRFLVTASSDQTLHLWDTATWREAALLKGNLSGISSVTFAPKGGFLATGGHGGEVRLWNPSIESRRNPFTRLDTQGKVVALDAAALVLKPSSNLCLIDVTNGKELKRFDLTGIDAIAFAASPDSQWVAVGTSVGELFVWSAGSAGILPAASPLDPTRRQDAGAPRGVAAVRAPLPNQPKRIPVSTNAITELQFSPDGKHLAAVLRNREIAMIELSTGRTVSRLVPSTADAWKLTLPENESEARSSSAGKVPEIRVVGETKVSIALSWPGPMVPQRGDTPMTDIAFSPNGLLLAVGDKDGTAAVWDFSQKQAIRILKGHLIEVTELAFSPDGRRLAVTSGDGSVSVWDVDSARRIASLTGTVGGLWSVSWSPDARRLVTGTGESTLLIWDLASSQAIVRLRGHAHSIVHARYLPDGNSLVTYAVDELFLWQAPP